MTETIRNRINRHRHDVVAIGLLILGNIIIFGQMMYRWRDDGDFWAHNELARMLVEDSTAFFERVPHFLYHLLAGVPYAITGIGRPNTYGVLIMIASYIALSLLLYLLVRRWLPDNWRGATMAIVATFALLFIAPITLFTPENQYFGYFPAHVYHNPTTQLMKPFAVLLFVAALRTYDAKFAQSNRIIWLIGYAMLTLLCLLAKPSYIIAVLPALALVTLVRMLRRMTINWLLLIGGIVLPAGALLFYQMFAWQSAVESDILLEPFRLFLEWSIHYDPNANTGLLLKLLLSVAFPLLVYLLHFRQAWRDWAFNLSWVTLGVALTYSYLLVDTAQIAAGDFVWSAQISVFMVFIAATLFLLRQYTDVFAAQAAPNWRLLLVSGVLTLHIVAGFNWYLVHLTQDYGSIIYVWW